MGNRRTGHTWAPGTGWVKKQETEKMSYESLGEGWIFLINFMRWYPDMVQDIFRSETADYELTPIQRIIMRAKARYQYVDITGCRGLTKSYCSINEELDENLLWPGTQCSYFGPNFKQTAKIGSQTFRQIEKDYPGLTAHFEVEAESTDRFSLTTQFGSRFSIAAFRGNNVHKVVAEEYAQDGDGTGGRFNDEDYKRIVLPSVRLQYMVKGKADPTYIKFKQHTITSAGRRQQAAYETRCRHYQMMLRGESAFVMDVPYDVLLLMLMRPTQWAESLKNELTPDEWAREMESRYTGSDTNPVISDRKLSECRSLLMPEFVHCCKDRDNKLSPDDVIYVIGYDVSYADGAKNAKCAAVVLKLTRQTDFYRRDKYLKQVVFVNDWAPKNNMEQAKMLKSLWYRYCVDDHPAYIAIDNWTYGTAVTQSLMTDLGDGLAPLCIYKHDCYTEYELEGCIPVVYPIRAGGVGTTDPDSEMVRNAELQFEYSNVELLTINYSDGMEAYKRYHRIKGDEQDNLIYTPYKKTNEMVGQIQNLKKVVSNLGVVTERRISQRIQRDSWSALKYALRFAQILERSNLQKKTKKSDWDELLSKCNGSVRPHTAPASSRVVVARRGGRMF